MADLNNRTPMSSGFGSGTSAAPPANRMMPGGFWRRVAAMFIDGLVLAIVYYPVSLGIQMAMGYGVMMNQGQIGPGFFLMMGLQYLVSFTLYFFYFGWFYSNKGASPGKMVMKLKVLDNDTGTNLSFVRGGLRGTIGYLISSITLFIGYLMVAFRQDKRGLHDLVFNTHVWFKEE